LFFEKWHIGGLKSVSVVYKLPLASIPKQCGAFSCTGTSVQPKSDERPTSLFSATIIWSGISSSVKSATSQPVIELASFSSMLEFKDFSV
jgi:hypothetical protein